MQMRAAIVLALLTGCAGNPPPDSEELALTSGPALSVVSVNVPPRAKPAGTLAVTITLRNTGSTTWNKASVVLRFTGDAGWTNADLPLTATTAPKANGTFTGTLGVPTQIGRYTLSWQAFDGPTPFGAPIAAPTEVTCSDGIFCNGDERYVNGKCVSGPPPCDDGVACTTDTCDEATMHCSHTLNGDACAMCAATNCTPHCAKGAVCGDDGCGGQCGTAPCPSGQACSAGQCVVALTPGTCANPLPITGTDPNAPVPPGSYTVAGDNTGGFDEV